MIHVIRSYLPADGPVTTAMIECDGCGKHLPGGILTSAENLLADRIRLRIEARKRRRWSSQTILWPQPDDEILMGDEPRQTHRIDLCPDCRRNVPARPWK